jgi:molybdopterin converting factor small subunit
VTPGSPPPRSSPVGPPWERPLNGRLDRLTIDSEVLVGNPLGDPTKRPLYVYLPPDFRAPLPSIYVIQGYSGQLDGWMNRSPFEPNIFERIDEVFSTPNVAQAIIVFVDAWTAVGGSQFLNSPGTGRYMDYLCDEVTRLVDERYPTIPNRDHRGLTGKSSGGYGAMVVPMLRPDVFGALASHAGDALFELCYLPEFGDAVRTLRDHYEGSYEKFFEHFKKLTHLDWDKEGGLVEKYGYAAAYSAEPDGTVLLPFELDTGRLIPEVWARWLEKDPVRMVESHADALRSMRLIYLDAGKSDEYYLDLGAQAFANELDRIGVGYTLEFFKGKHGGIQYRYPKALRALAEALAP